MLLLAIVAGITVHRRFDWDDAYITFRMARNIAHGHGWTFNPGQSQDAATGALWTLLLAGCAWLHIGIVGAANVLSVLFLAGSAILMFETFDLLGERRCGIVVGVLIASSEFLLLSAGMEIPLALLLISAATYFAQRGWLVWAGTAASLGVVTRGDVALYLGVLGISLAFSRRVAVWRFAAAAGAVLLAWGLVAVILIGHLLPDTLTAKMAQGRSVFWTGPATYLGALRSLPSAPPYGGGHTEVWFVAILGLAVLGLPTLFAKRRMLPLISFGVIYVLAYGYILRVPAYTWYYEMPLFTAIVGAGVGLDAMWRLLTRHRGVLHGAVPIGLAVGLGLVSLAGAPSPAPRLASYVAASRWLNTHAPPDKSLAAAEVGVIGWNNPDRTVIDYLGLTSKTAAERVRHDDLLWWVYHDHPDYWLTLKTASFPVDQQLLNAPWLTKAFRPVWSDHSVVLFERIGPIPPQA